MKAQSEINQRILNEIKNIEVEEGMQSFLEDVLMIELNNMDKENWRFSEEYEDQIEKFHNERSKKCKAKT